MSESDSNNEETFNDFSSTSISDSDNKEPFNTEFTGDIVKLKPYDFEPLVPNNCQVETAEDSLSPEIRTVVSIYESVMSIGVSVMNAKP